MVQGGGGACPSEGRPHPQTPQRDDMNAVARQNAGAYRMRSLPYERMGSPVKAASDRNVALSVGR